VLFRSQALVRIGHHQQVALVAARAGQQPGRAVLARYPGGERGHHRGEALRVRTRSLGRGLRLAQLGRGDHLLGLGDLLGRFDRVDPPFEFLETGHRFLLRHPGKSRDRCPRGRPLGRDPGASPGMDVNYANCLAKASRALTVLSFASSPNSLLSRISASTSACSARMKASIDSSYSVTRLTGTGSRNPLVPAKIDTVCSSNGIGEN